MAADAAAVERLNIVIIGGGVIGCSAAYYLTRHPTYEPGRHAITLLEATRLAAGASGKASGLLARWAYPSCLVPLSFDLHAQLAAEHGGASAWGYRTIRCGKLTARDRRLDSPEPPSSSASWAQRIAAWVPLPKLRDLHEDHGGTPAVGAAVPDDLDWFRRDGVVAYEDIAPQSETAQVHPHQFTTALARLAEERGARILVGAAAEEIQYTLGGGSITSEKGGGEEIEGGQTGASGPRGKAVRSVRYVDKATGQSVSIRADVVILAAGPWTPDLFPAVPMRALRAHSITVKPTRKLSAYCLFTDISLPLPAMHRSDVEKTFLDDDYSSLEHRLHPSSAVYVVSPEIYSRPNNEVYVAGEGDSRVPLPPSTDEVEVDRAACDVIEEAAAGVSDELRGGLVTGRRACYLPTVDLPSGNPLIGPTWVDGLILATGHGCWGIHNAPATGKLVSEMVFDGEARSADSSGLDPRIVI